MNLEDFAVNVHVDHPDVPDYVETSPTTVLGNIRGELKPSRSFTMTWAGGEEVTEKEMLKLIQRWGLVDTYNEQIERAREKRRRAEQKANPKAATRPELTDDE